MIRRFVSTRPFLGSALAGLVALATFAAINLAAGESATASVIGGLVVGVAVGGALALRNLLSRRQPR
jgi:hypothetical protein